jgi:glutamine synthetase
VVEEAGVPAINTIVTDIKGNIRIYKLPLGPSTDLETDISLAFGSDNIISISLYHDP